MKALAKGLIVLGLLGAGLPAAAADYTLNAFAPLIVTGEHSVTTDEGTRKIGGSIQGPLYVERDGARVEAGQVTCRFTLTIVLDTLEETGNGTCRIAYPDGEIRADTSCTGFGGVGCDGEFRVTDGSGRFEGASGAGPVRFQTREKVYSLAADGSVSEVIFGVAYWEDYIISLPD